MFLYGCFNDRFTGDHHTQIDDTEPVALQHHGNDIFPDVMHIPFHRGKDHRFPCGGSGSIVLKDHRHQFRHCIFHHAGGLDDLRQEHFARTEPAADFFHTVHERSFDDLYGIGIFFQSFCHIFSDISIIPVDQSVADPIFQRFRSPCRRSVIRGKFLSGETGGDLQQFGSGIGRRIQNHILRGSPQYGIDLCGKLGRIHDPHIQSGTDRVIEEHTVQCRADRFISPEREGHIADPAGEMAGGEILFQDPDGFNEIHTVGIVFRQTCGDSKYIHIKDDVAGIKARLFREKMIHSAADCDSAFQRICLTFFIKCHTQDRRTEFFCFFCMSQKNIFTFFQADGVDHAFALNAAECGTDHIPAGGIDHHGDACNIRFPCKKQQKTG